MKNNDKHSRLNPGIVVIIIALLSPVFSFAQLRIDWQYCYGSGGHDYPTSVLPVKDGYLVCGQVPKSQNMGMITCGMISDEYNIWLIRIDDQGVLQDQQCWSWDEDVYLREPISIEKAKTEIKENNEYYYMNAHAFGKVTLLKLDENFNEIWRRTPGYYGTQMLPTADGGLLLGGSYGQMDKGPEKDSLLKMDSEGNTEWKISIGMEVVKTAQAKDGGFLVGGSSRENLYDYSLLKIDRNGQIEWSRSTETMPRIIMELDDGFLLATDTGRGGENAHGGFDILLSRTDVAGNILWNRYYGGSLSDMLCNIFPNANGGFTVFGYTNSNDGDLQNKDGNDYDIWAFHVNASGELVWERSIGSPAHDEWIDYIYSVKRTDEYKYAVAGRMVWEEMPSGDVNCSNSAVIPNSGMNYWVLHVTDTINSMGVPDPLSQVGVQMFPNPTKGTVHIQGITSAEVLVYDAHGQCVKTIHNTNEIPLSDLPKGVYLIKAVLADGKVYTDKVVKE